MSRHGQRGGFTLIEVLIALAILGLVLSTGFRIMRSSIDRLRIETDAIELAAHAEALWYTLRLEGLRQRDGLSLELPEAVTFDFQTRPIAESELDGWQAKGDIEWVTLNVRLHDQQIRLEGVMPTGQ